MVYPPQDLVDLVWTNQPPKCKAPVFKQEAVYRGTFIANMQYFYIQTLFQDKARVKNLRYWIGGERYLG